MKRIMALTSLLVMNCAFATTTSQLERLENLREQRLRAEEQRVQNDRVSTDQMLGGFINRIKSMDRPLSDKKVLKQINAVMEYQFFEDQKIVEYIYKDGPYLASSKITAALRGLSDCSPGPSRIYDTPLGLIETVDEYVCFYVEKETVTLTESERNSRMCDQFVEFEDTLESKIKSGNVSDNQILLYETMNKSYNCI